MKKITEKDLIGVPFSTLSKNKKKNYVIRQAYYYRNGRSQHIMVEKLKEKFPDVNIVDTWDKFVAFRGGASVANQSHFGVEFNFNQQTTEP